MTLNLQTPFPTFGGSTGGWLRAAETEEKYAGPVWKPSAETDQANSTIQRVESSVVSRSAVVSASRPLSTSLARYDHECDPVAHLESPPHRAG